MFLSTRPSRRCLNFGRCRTTRSHDRILPESPASRPILSCYSPCSLPRLSTVDTPRHPPSPALCICYRLACMLVGHTVFCRPCQHTIRLAASRQNSPLSRIRPSTEPSKSSQRVPCRFLAHFNTFKGLDPTHALVPKHYCPCARCDAAGSLWVRNHTFPRRYPTLSHGRVVRDVSRRVEAGSRLQLTYPRHTPWLCTTSSKVWGVGRLRPLL